MRRIVDAHEDIAWNALALRRDVRRCVQETRDAEQREDVARSYGTAVCLSG